MKKTHGINKSLCFILSLCLFLFNISGCGIDDVISIAEPTSDHISSYNSSDYSLMYFMFTTADYNMNGDSSYSFLGTEVYYKIYSSYSDMLKEKDKLNELASDSTTSGTSASKLIDNYDFKALKASNYNKSILIPASLGKQIVYIRLTDYYDSPEYSARILLGGENGTNLSGTTDVCAPRRNADADELSFNFGRTSQNPSLNQIPVIDDSDVEGSSAPSDGKWYVLMYAVTVAKDTTYKKIYSNICYLGDVAIDSTSENN